MRILVADDDEATRLSLQLSLEKLGHEVVVCRDGQDVLARLFAGDLPQIVFLDWMMPGLSGLDVCRKIRERRDLAFTYILLLTGRSEREDIISGLRSGANDYIPKPLMSDELRSRLQVAIQVVDANNLIADQRLRLISSAKMALLGEMAAGVAHEINNPLAIVLTQIDRLVDEGTAGTDANQSLDSISRMARKIAKIVESLRAFAADGETEPFRAVPVNAVIENVLMLCREKIKYQNIHLDVGLAPAELAFEVQSAQVGQALMNLVQNAVEALEGRRDKTISVDVSHDSECVLIAVSDNGKGVPEANRNKIMVPFFTTKEVGSGPGLGLSVAKGIVDAHGGNLKLDTTSLVTRFVVSIPILRAA